MKELKKDDKFVAYNLTSGRKALWGGICTVTEVAKKQGRVLVVHAIDSMNNKRVFPAGRKWGFLKR